MILIIVMSDDSPERVDDWVQEELHEGEDSEDDPVPQPSPGTLRRPVEDRLERHEGGVDHPDQGAGDECVQVHGSAGESGECDKSVSVCDVGDGGSGLSDQHRV